MRRNRLMAAALGAALFFCAGNAMASFAGPGPWLFHDDWVWGNDTGGIIPYNPELRGRYREIAAEYCARWERHSHVTSVHPKYGDYVSFVCIDRRGVIH